MHKLFLSITILLITMDGKAQTTPKALSNKIIKTFQAKNFTAYRTLFIDTADYKEILTGMYREEGCTSKTSMEEAFINFIKGSDTAYKNRYDEIMKQGESLKIDWSQIQPGKFIYKVVKPQNSDKKLLTGHLNFTSNGKAFVLFGIEAVKVSSGFKLTNIRNILKGGVAKYVDPDSLEDEEKKDE